MALYKGVENMKVQNNIIINENKVYRDIETGEIITQLELYHEYLNTDQGYSFWGYLRNCTDKNGFLEEV